MNRKYQIALAVVALALVVILVVVYVAGRFSTSSGRPALSQVGLQTVTITVAGGKEFRTRTLLNSHKDFRSPDNFTVVLQGDARRPLEELVGKTVTATGTPSSYKGRPQLVVTDPANLSVR
jgi:hypothetical protein